MTFDRPPFRVELPGDLKPKGPVIGWTNVRPPSELLESVESIAFVVYQLPKPEERK